MSNILPFFSVYILVLKSWFCSVCEKSFSRKDSKQRHVTSKQRNVGLASFQTVQCLHKNVCGFASNILLPPWLLKWPGPEKRPGFDLYYNKLQRQFTFPRRGSFGVNSQWQPAYIEMLVAMPYIEFVKVIFTAWSRIPILMWTNGIWSCLIIRWLTPVKTSDLWTSLLVVLIIEI